MTDPNLAELPVETTYSENINRQMQVPDKIRLDQSFSMDSQSDMYDTYERHKLADTMKMPGYIGYGDKKRGESFSGAGINSRHPWPLIEPGDAMKITTPPQKLRVNGLTSSEFITRRGHSKERRSKTDLDLPNLLTNSKYPQERVADTHNPLREYDYNEDELLNDLDQTSEVDKLRQQNFKLFRRIARLEDKVAQQNFTLACWLTPMCAAIALLGIYVVRRCD